MKGGDDMPEMIPVSSSNLSAVGYDATTKQLFIRFTTSTYVYSGVPASIYHGLMSASSHGQYHAQFIKHAFPYRRIA